MKKLVFLCCCILWGGCSDDKNVSIPSTVLSEQKMADVMTDIHLLEATLNSNFVQFPSSGRFSKEKKDTVLSFANLQSGNIILKLLNKRGVSAELYKKSYLFYTENPELLNEVYKLIINNLSELQAKIATEKDPPSKDSTGMKKP